MEQLAILHAQLQDKHVPLYAEMDLKKVQKHVMIQELQTEMVALQLALLSLVGYVIQVVLLFVEMVKNLVLKLVMILIQVLQTDAPQLVEQKLDGAAQHLDLLAFYYAVMVSFNLVKHVTMIILILEMVAH